MLGSTKVAGRLPWVGYSHPLSINSCCDCEQHRASQRASQPRFTATADDPPHAYRHLSLACRRAALFPPLSRQTTTGLPPRRRRANKRRVTAPVSHSTARWSMGRHLSIPRPYLAKGPRSTRTRGRTQGRTRGRQTPEAKRHGGSRDDADETPRPGRIVSRRAAIHGFQGASAGHSGTGSQSQSSSRTRTSSQASTRKRRRQLEVGHEPVKVITFASASSQDQNDFTLPLPLQELLRDFEAVHDGITPFVSQSRKPELVTLGFRDSA